MSDILVTGASGTTGRHVAAGLVERGATVRAASRTPTFAAGNNPMPVSFDWQTPSTWEPVLRGVDAVYLVKPEVDEAVQIVEDFLGMAKDCCAARIVLLSEIAAETRPDDARERQIERLVEQSGFDWTILRPNWFMQDLVDERFFGSLIRQDGVIVMTTGGAAMSWIDARDIAAVAVELLLGGASGNQALTLTGPEAVTLDQLTDRMKAVAGVVVQPVEESTEAAEQRMRSAGVDEGFIVYFSNIGRSIMKGDTAPVTDVVARVTGHRSRSLDAFLIEYAPLLQRVAGQ